MPPGRFDEDGRAHTPLTAHAVRLARAKLAHELIELVATDVDSNAPEQVQVLVAGTLDALGLLHTLLSARDIPW